MNTEIDQYGAPYQHRGVDVDPAKLREARLQAGVSLAYVAGGMISRAAVQQYETGRSRPTMVVLEHLAHRLGKPAEFFLANPDQPYGPTRTVREVVHVPPTDWPLGQVLTLATRQLSLKMRAWKPELSDAEYESLNLGLGFLRSFSRIVRALEREFKED